MSFLNNEILITIFSVLIFVALAVVMAFNVIDSVHFFQLNSYRHDTHRKWLRENKIKFIVPLILGLAAAGTGIITPISTVCFLAAIAIMTVPKKGKKPLVYTARVKRMLLTTAVITVIPVVIICIFCKTLFLDDYSILGLVAGIYAAISPEIVLLADLINKPMEKNINNGYIKDAKKILAACPDLKIIGVTGSYGKTSVKYYLNTLLQAQYNVLMTPESYNTPMGVVKTIRGSLKSTHEIFICEMGAKWVGDIKELCDIVHPQHGVITSIGPQHLESFGSLDNVKSTKFELADSLGKEGYLFLNGNDENIKDHGCNRPYISYTLEGDGDYNATDIKVSSKGTTFTVTKKTTEKIEKPKAVEKPKKFKNSKKKKKGKNGKQNNKPAKFDKNEVEYEIINTYTSETFTTKLIGKHNVINITGAIAIANTFGIPMSKLKGQVRKLEGVPHRLALSDNGLATIIDDAYNSNPSGSKAALEVLALFDGYKICVTPGMVELGDEQFELNKKFGEYMADTCDYVVLVGKKQSVPMKEGLLEKNYPEDKIYVADTIQEALNHVYALNSKGEKKVILLENDLPDNY